MSTTADRIRQKAVLREAKKPILSRIRSADSLREEDFRFRALLLGDSGGGKSTSAITLPGKKLVIELDGRKESLAGYSDIDIVEINEPDIDKPTAWKDLLELKKELWKLAKSSDPFPYDGIILDGITRLGRFALNFALAVRNAKGNLMETLPGGGPSQAHYGPQMWQFSRFCNELLPLPCHMVFTGHVEQFEDKKIGTIEYWPKVYGKTRTEICSWFNETYFCFRKKDKYFWRTAPKGRHKWLKSAANQQGRYWDGDLEIDFSKSPCGFAEVLQRRFKK